MPDFVEVLVEQTTVEVVIDNTTVVEVLTGPPGPQGIAGSTGAIVYIPPAPASTWTIPHTLGRVPAVSVYLAGELVLVPVSADTHTVSISFPTPQTGVAVLT